MATRILICLALLIAGALASTVVFPTPGTFTCVPDTQLHPLASGFKLSWCARLTANQQLTCFCFFFFFVFNTFHAYTLVNFCPRS
jgi:hypothetical protein